jgi:outer membrane lipoprotein-sorting protein
MRKTAGLTAVLCLVCVSLAGAWTADELIAKNIAARGGAEKIHAVQSLRIAGTMRFGGGNFSNELAYSELDKRPDMLRTEFSLQGLTAIVSYDGVVGWRIQPFSGRMDPEKLSADDLKSLKHNADIDGPLYDYKGKGSTVEYLGTEDVDGTEAHKLKVTFKDGDVRYIFLDPDYFLEIRFIDQTRVRGVENEQETDVGSYEEVNGVYFPFSIESGPKGGPKNQKLTIQKIEMNVPLEDSLFHFPAK